MIIECDVDVAPTGRDLLIGFTIQSVDMVNVPSVSSDEDKTALLLLPILQTAHHMIHKEAGNEGEK